MVQAIDDSLLRRGDSRAAALLVAGGSGTAFGVPSLTHLAPCSYSGAWCELLRGVLSGGGKALYRKAQE